jgi:hypothetical protein
MKKLYFILVVAGFLSISFSAQAIHFPSFGERIYQVPYAVEAPKIDGVINEDEWQYAVKLPSGGPMVRQAEFMITWREDAIYIAQRSPLRPGEVPLCRFRDSKVGTSCHDDTCEVYIKTDQEGKWKRVPEFFQTIFGPADNVFFHMDNQYSIGQKVLTWDPGWISKNRITPDGKFWETECRIPVKNYYYKGDLKNGTVWNICFNRNWKRPWQWGGIDYKMPAAKAVFRKNIPAVELSNIGELNAGKVDPVLKINPLGKDFDGTAEFKIVQEDSSKKEKVVLDKSFLVDFKGGKTVKVGDFASSDLLKGKSGFLTVIIKRKDGKTFFRWDHIFKEGDLKGAEFVPSKDAFFVDILSNPVKNLSYIQADYYELSKSLREAVVSSRISIAGQSGKEIMGLDCKPKDFSLSGQLLWPKNLKPGNYEYQVVLYDKDGKELKKVNKPFANFDLKKEFPWWGNNIGMEKILLEPWTQVIASKEMVKVWARDISFADTGFLKQLNSKKEDLLAAPISLIAKDADGKILKLKGDGIKLLDNSQFIAKHQGGVSGDGLKVKVLSETEFDGCVKVIMEIEPEAKSIELSELALEIPFRKEAAKYLRASHESIRLNIFAGNTPEGKGVVWDSKSINVGHPMTVGSFAPYIWLGAEERGMCFFADSDEGWFPSEKRAAEEVIRKDDSVILRVNFISEKSLISGKRKIVFGLMANPVKPLTKSKLGFEGMFFGGDRRFGRFDPKSKVGRGTQCQVPHPMLEDVSREKIKAYRAKGVAVSPYLAHTDTPAIDQKEWKCFSGAWTSNEPGAIKPHNLRIVRSLADYQVYNYDQWMKTCNISGFYIDNIYCNMTRNADMGPAYRLPDGRIQPGFMIWENREYIRRLQTVLQMRGVKPRALWLHMTNHVLLPVLSFCDDTLQGEDRAIEPGGANHIQQWPQADLVTSCYSPAFGWRCHFLGSWRVELNDKAWDKLGDPGAAKVSRGIVASLWPLGMLSTWRGNKKVQHKASFDLFNFTGNREAIVFGHPWYPDTVDHPIPYWKSGEYLTTSNSDVITTIWKKDDRMLLMLSNLGKKVGTVNVNIDLNKFWQPRAPIGGDFYYRENLVIDQEAGKAVMPWTKKFDRAKNQLEFKVEVAPYDFRLIQILR